MQIIQNAEICYMFIFTASPMRSSSPTKDGYMSDKDEFRRKQTYGNYATVDDEPDLGIRRPHEE